jgi:indole-3-glycerol phosphate synthase
LDVVQARENLEHTPLLFKEFLTEPYQLYLAKASGADVVLLIAACLERSQCQELALEAKELGLETLLEIHSEDELSHYDESFVNVLGVNNRNLKIFKTDVQISRDIVKNLPENTVKISESGISKPETVAELRKLGFNGFLMGENFMKESNPGIALKNFIDNVLTLL